MTIPSSSTPGQDSALGAAIAQLQSTLAQAQQQPDPNPGFIAGLQLSTMICQSWQSGQVKQLAAAASLTTHIDDLSKLLVDWGPELCARAARNGSPLQGATLELIDPAAGRWSFVIALPFRVTFEPDVRHPTRHTALAAVGPAGILARLMRRPEDLVEELPRIDLIDPLGVAQVYELLHPGAQTRHARAFAPALAKSLTFTPTPLGTRLDALLPTLFSRAALGMPTVRATYQLEIAGLGTYFAEVADRQATVSRSARGQPKCLIEVSATDLEMAFHDPLHLLQALLDGRLKVSNPCRARQLVLPLLHDAVGPTLPRPLYVALYDPSAPEQQAQGPFRRGYLHVNGVPRPVMFQDVGGTAIVEGDIIVGTTKEMLAVADAIDSGRALPEAIFRRDYGDPTKYLWPNRTLYYQCAADLKDPSRVTDAIKFFDKVNVSFEVGQTSAGNYVSIVNSTINDSLVGMVGGVQTLNISAAASAGNLAHELCHALGLYHEQSRYDRDDWITINWDNIESGKKSNFEEKLPSLDAYTTLADVVDRIADPPTSPAEGARYLVKVGGTGAFAGHDNQIATFSASTWTFASAATNDLVRVTALKVALAWNGTTWDATTTTSGDDGAYDYGSIMHYGPTAFGTDKNSSKKNTTIEAKKSIPKGVTMGQRDKLADTDIATLNLLYPA